MSRQGFLLQASLRPPSRSAGRPVLQLYGRLADGQTFLISDDREVPYFYVRTADVPHLSAGGAGALRVAPTTRRTLAGEPVSRVEVATPAAQQELVARLIESGIPTYEADLNLVARYLIDRGVRGSLEIHGAARGDAQGSARPGRRPTEGVDLVFVNPEVSPGSGVPPLFTLALRVAVDRDGKLAAVALYDRHGGEVLCCGEPAGPTHFADERALLLAVMERVRARDPDVLIGWDLLPIDLTTLRAAAARTRQTLVLGRGPGGLQLLPGGARGRGGPPRAVVAGRMVLDVAAVVQLVAPQVSDEALEVVAARVLAARTPPALRPGAVASAPGEVSTDQLLAEAQAIYEVTAALQLIELVAQRSRLCGLPLDRTLASVAAFDYLYLLELGRRGFVAPTFQRPLVPGESVVGGHIIAPLPGVHRGIVVLDFRSLYPSLIRTFQIDPLGLLPADGATPLDPAEDPIVAPSGARFRRQLGVLTVILDQIFPMRAAAKAEGDAAASQAIKLLMNSLYGVLGSPGCPFHRPELANAVTSFGRELLKWTQARVQAYGYKVVYGDTDSLFIASGRTGDSAADAVALRRFGEELAARLTRDLGEHIRATWGVESRLDLQLQTVYLRLLLTRLRRGARRRGEDTPPIERDGLLHAPGAAKRYAGLCVDSRDGERRRLVFVGMEAVRRDATDLCKEAQRTLHELLFTDRPAAELENYLHRLVSELRRGQLDGQLVYRKLLRKEPASYLQKPPHVQVAQQLGLPVGRLVRYVITRAGPQPASLSHRGATAPLDYDHYVDKQLRPAAQPVLELYGLDFDRIVGRERQLKLF